MNTISKHVLDRKEKLWIKHETIINSLIEGATKRLKDRIDNPHNIAFHRTS